jgi:hypothetical protein
MTDWTIVRSLSGTDVTIIFFMFVCAGIVLARLDRLGKQLEAVSAQIRQEQPGLNDVKCGTLVSVRSRDSLRSSGRQDQCARSCPIPKLASICGNLRADFGFAALVVARKIHAAGRDAVRETIRIAQVALGVAARFADLEAAARVRLRRLRRLRHPTVVHALVVRHQAAFGSWALVSTTLHRAHGLGQVVVRDLCERRRGDRQQRGDREGEQQRRAHAIGRVTAGSTEKHGLAHPHPLHVVAPP